MQIPGVDFLVEQGVPLRAAQGIIVGVVLVVAYLVLSKLFKGGPANTHLTAARCGSCGWVGSVSKHKPVCPKCAAKISV